MEKIELVIKRMRWKAFFYSQEENETIPENYGLKTLKCPPRIKDMDMFENDLLDLVKKIKFRQTKSKFQDELKNDIKKIKDTKTTLTFADKTSNIYKLKKDNYENIVTNAITTSYKKVSNKIQDQINQKGKEIIKDKAVINRMFVNGKNNCFITLKDHKHNFENHPKVRLLNPAKNELGRISKTILEKINSNLRAVLKLNQWKDTSNVIEWFENIKNKQKYKFIMFDIKDFYPSISKKLLSDSLQFAETKIKIDQNDKDIIYHARKSLLFNKDETWMKKGNDLFDVTMGAWDGAEISELTGLFILNLLSEIFNKNDIGLYRDDGLGVVKNSSGPQIEKIKKNIQKIFKDNGLDVIIDCNQKIVNYLDVTLNLIDGSYKPYHKPDNNIQYINIESNHPPNIIKQLPKTIEKRLSKLSSSEKIFNESTKFYEEKLKQSGYNVKLKYHPQKEKTNTPNRKRKIIWFNPPFNKNVTTKIGKYFLNLIDKHFPPHHRLHKIFNRNNVKISYSCTKNIKNIINNHNMNILNNKTNEIQRSCNCRNRDACPLNGFCLEGNIVYQGTVTSNEINYKPHHYLGIAEESFKSRFNNHKKSFNNEYYRNETELAKEIWKIKSKNYTPTISWKIVRKCLPFNPCVKRCHLCLNEKLEIALFKEENLLNKKSELISKCRHQNKFMLIKHDSKD